MVLKFCYPLRFLEDSLHAIIKFMSLTRNLCWAIFFRSDKNRHKVITIKISFLQREVLTVYGGAEKKIWVVARILKCIIWLKFVLDFNSLWLSGILLHGLPVVAVLFIQSNTNEGAMKNSILHEIFCKSLFRTSRPIVKLEFSCSEINTAIFSWFP